MIQTSKKPFARNIVFHLHDERDFFEFLKRDKCRANEIPARECKISTKQKK